LNYENIPLPDVLLDADEGVVVGELEDVGLTQRYVEVLAYGLSQLRVSVPGKDFEFVDKAIHDRPSLIRFLGSPPLHHFPNFPSHVPNRQSRREPKTADYSIGQRRGVNDEAPCFQAFSFPFWAHWSEQRLDRKPNMLQRYTKSTSHRMWHPEFDLTPDPIRVCQPYYATTSILFR
jgi:hypothetical protein